MVSYLQNVVALSLFIIKSEACLPTPPSPPAPTLTPTPAPTTAKPKECPMDEKSCVGLFNVLNIIQQDMIGPDVCNQLCEGDSKCKFWTYIPTRRVCFLLSSCSETEEKGIISGEKGCKITPSYFTIFNLFLDKPAMEIKIEWEFSSVCPDVSIVGEIAPLDQVSDRVKYFEKPDSIKCGKLKKVSGKIDLVDCTPLVNVDPANIYIKLDSANPTKCVIEQTSKIVQ